MFHILEANTANLLWMNCAKWFFSPGIATEQKSRNGATLEVMNTALTLIEPRQRWISARIPAMNPAFAIAEVVWIVCGRQDSGMLNYFNPILPKYAGSGATYHGAYGYRIRNGLGIDQLERAYQVLSKNEDSRQVVLQIWDPKLDLPNESGAASAPDIPCNISSLVKVRDGKLEWTQIMRSNDLYRGFPHNVIQFTSLQEVLAGWLNLEVGTYHHYSDSMHLYEADGDAIDHFEEIEPPLNQECLRLPKVESEKAFHDLSELCDICADSRNTAERLKKVLSAMLLPSGYLNMARVLVADSLRRRSDTDGAVVILEEITNECLKFMYSRWFDKPRGISSSKG